MSIKKEHWLVWFVTKAWHDVKRKDLYVEQLLDILFLLNREFKRRFGRRLLDFEFTAWLDGLHSYEFYETLERCADMRLVEYIVSVKLPEAPDCDDEDARAVYVKHELDRVDAKYVLRTVKPLAEAVDPPQDLLRLLEDVGATLGDLVAAVRDLVEYDARGEVKKVLEAVEIGQRVE